MASTWREISEDTASIAANPTICRRVFPGSQPDPQFFHQYLQLVVSVEDDYGQDVGDYFLEFFGPDAKQDEEAVFFHREVLKDVHPNSLQSAMRCLFVDRNDLLTEYYQRIPRGKAREVAMSISAAAPGDTVDYFRHAKFGAAGHYVVHREAEENRWLQRNSTHFVKIIIPRTPRDRVFMLTRAQGRTAEREWDGVRQGRQPRAEPPRIGRPSRRQS